jgi:hypothetical protein
LPPRRDRQRLAANGGGGVRSGPRRRRLLGAVIEDFIKFNSRNSREVPQLDHVSRQGATRLVTFSIGGNDVGFGDVLASCVVGLLNSARPGCAQREDAAVKQAIGWLTDGRPAGCHSLPGINSATKRSRRIAFVSVDEAFDEHRLCDSSASWICGLEFNTGNLPNDPVKQVSFHPSDAGQQAMGRLVREKL